MDGRDFNGNGNNNNGASSSSTATATTAATATATATACGFYIWDAPSALLYKWCHSLMKDCVYEGLGGRKFVRIEPGSLLQLLYPCSRYKPDKCLLCGGHYKDHLTLSWAKHLYTPLDLYLDKITTDATAVSAVAGGSASTTATTATATATASSNKKEQRNKSPRGQHKKTSRKKRKHQSSSTNTIPSIFNFHTRYVTDVDPNTWMMDGTTNKVRLAKIWQNKLQRYKQHRTATTTSATTPTVPMEMRTLQQQHTHKTYIVPALRRRQSSTTTSSNNNNNNNNTKNIDTNNKQQHKPLALLALGFTRYIVLNTMDRFIKLQELENNNIRQQLRQQQQQQSNGWCCP